ncbi:MAG: deoxynucleoside kinase [Faecalibacterium sp.]|nr:deoxynucleoside kinase [Ruminococcus sp.]MCM1391678.1 deoxynucleoside kinase [Ruminococcus sp.]MCM1485980.1 deoxynucleoside kinase [Faecalibacterium sp.]
MGKMIVIEGLDASGKGTQTKLLKSRLEEYGKRVFGISLPNYDDNSSALVKMYLAGEMGSNPSDVNAFAASTFYAVDRYASFKKYWNKEYNSDQIIVADRYTTSNASHQMTKLPREQWDFYLDWLFDFEYRKLEIPEPDCVIFLDMPVEVSQELLKKRYNNDEGKKDVHEKDVEYLKHCYEAASYAANKLGWSIIKCSCNGKPRSIEEISDEIFAVVERKLLND